MNNIKKLRIANGLTQQDLAERLSVERTSIGKYEKHDVLPSKEVLFKLADFFDVSIDYLLGRSMSAKAQQLDSEQLHFLNQYLAASEKAQRAALLVLELGQQHNLMVQSVPSGINAVGCSISIPVVGRAAAGLPIEMISENDEESISVDGIRHGDFGVIAVGDSMIDVGINDGDRVVIRPQYIVENGELALVAINDGSTIKKFYTEENGIRLAPANEKHNVQYYSFNENVRVLGKVVKIVKK